MAPLPLTSMDPRSSNSYLFFTRLKTANVQSARTTLRQAVVAAEQKTGGKGAEAEVKQEGSALHYEVTVVGGGRTQKVKIDEDGKAVMPN